VFAGDVLDASFAADSFDVITCFHVLEHLYEPKAIVAKVFSWLKPGGIFYVMVPNIDSAAVRVFGSFWYGLELPRHLWHFSPVSLQNLGTAVGLQPISISTHREVLLEPSTRYVADEVLRAVGIRRVPLAKAGMPSMPWRVMRKALRLTVLPILSICVSLVGDGESIHALFVKPARCVNGTRTRCQEPYLTN
jgi:SAM-dependent methyltransferase